MDFFIRFCLRDRDPRAPETRQWCGALSGGLGLALNLLLPIMINWVNEQANGTIITGME